VKDDGRYSRRVKIYHGGGYGSAKSTPDHWREVIVGYGFLVPEGAMPVFSVDTEEEAKALIVTACPLNYDGEYFSRELAQEQTLENLQAFSDKLAYCWQLMEEAKSTCWLDSPQDAASQEEADNGLPPQASNAFPWVFCCSFLGFLFFFQRFI
jgi:hypothetical protein